MNELTFYTLDVFTDEIFGGNQLAVFPQAPALDDRMMQAIARELSLSETVFVHPARTADALCRLRIFTPSAELPFAGHPTIGTAQLLVELGIAPPVAGSETAFVLEEGIGLVPVSVSTTGDGKFFTWLSAARLPERGPPAPPPAALAALLGILPEAVVRDETHAPDTYSAGVPFTFVPVRDRKSLAQARLDPARWHDTLAGTWAPQVYVFCRAENASGIDFHARMFAPALDIAEDPTTGAAATAFAGHLWERARRPGRWVIAQGEDMGRPSTIHVEASGAGAQLRTVRVGGSAVRVSRGTLQLP